MHCKNRIVIITKGCLFPEIHYCNKLNFVQITIFPQIDSCLCYLENFLCELTIFLLPEVHYQNKLNLFNNNFVFAVAIIMAYMQHH